MAWFTSSAGVTLNWKRPASARELGSQGLLDQWTCSVLAQRTLNEAGYQDLPGLCQQQPQGVQISATWRLTVDFRAMPHAEVDEVEYIRPRKPEVSTRDEPWHSLPDPRIGRYRTSREGLVSMLAVVLLEEVMPCASNAAGR